MAEYIEREKAIDRIKPHVKPTTVYGEGYMQAIEHAVDILELIPAADVQPVKRGHWIDMGDHEQCSECKATRLKEFQSYYGKVSRWEKTNFCPNCGADMREEV